MNFRQNVAMWLAGFGVALDDIKSKRLDQGIAIKDSLMAFEGIRESETYAKLRKEFAVSMQGGTTGDAVMNSQMQLDFMLMVNPAHCRE